MKLDLSSFHQALASLDEALQEWARAPSSFVKDSCIQRFEYSYELAWKMLRRQLALMAPTPIEVDQLSFQDLIRLGAERGLLMSSWDRWALYRDARNATSHAYNQQKADEVFAHIAGFSEEARFLLMRLTERQI